MGRLADWKPYETAVQPELNDGEYVSGQFTMLAAGPPRLANLGGKAIVGASGLPASNLGDWAYPIGVLQGFSLGQNMNISRFFELGSQRSYFVPGRVMGQIQLNRVMYYGPSLLKMLYAYYRDIGPFSLEPLFSNPAFSALANPKPIKLPPGYENIFLNLASDLFTQPVGLLLYLRDSYESTVAAAYAECALVPSHNIGADSGGLVIQEGVSLQYERIVPVAVKGVGLITNSEIDVSQQPGV